MLIGKILPLGAEKIHVENKSDLPDALTEDDRGLLESFSHRVVMSASRGYGLSALEEMIASIYNEGGLDLSCDAVIWSAAQRASLDRAASLLAEAKSAITDGAALDAAGVMCETALAELRMVDGRGVSEDIIDGIFSKFCVGK